MNLIYCKYYRKKKHYYVLNNCASHSRYFRDELDVQIFSKKYK